MGVKIWPSGGGSFPTDGRITLAGHTDSARAVAWGPNFLASGSWDTTIRMWLPGIGYAYGPYSSESCRGEPEKPGGPQGCDRTVALVTDGSVGTHTVTIRLTDDVTGKYDERELTVTLSEASSRRSRKRRSSDTHQIRFALSPSGELSGTVQRDKTAGNSNAQHRNKVIQHDANDIMRQIQQGSANSVASTVAPTTVSDRDPGAPSELEVTGSGHWSDSWQLRTRRLNHRAHRRVQPRPGGLTRTRGHQRQWRRQRRSHSCDCSRCCCGCHRDRCCGRDCHDAGHDTSRPRRCCHPGQPRCPVTVDGLARLVSVDVRAPICQRPEPCLSTVSFTVPSCYLCYQQMRPGLGTGDDPPSSGGGGGHISAQRVALRARVCRL